MLQETLDRLRAAAPLVHCITNYVTANDCANILLACGASPVMAEDPGEVEEVTAQCGALVLNTGTLRQSVLPAMLAAGARANALGLPVVLDPVGAGSSRLRTESACTLLEQLQPAAIRGNLSEMRALAGSGRAAHGVDAAPADRITAGTLDQTVAFAKSFARQTGAVIAITGSIDVVTDGGRAFCIRNGCPEMSRVTGTGCQLSAMMGACLAAVPQEPLAGAVTAVCAMGLCGQLARRRMTPLDGNASYRNYIIDAVYNLTGAQLEEGADYEVR